MANRTRTRTTAKNRASGDVNILRSRRTDHICEVTRNKKIRLFISVGDCDKVGRKIGAKECPDGGTHNGTYNAVILEKGERSGYTGILKYFYEAGTSRRFTYNLVQSEIHSQN